MTKPRYQFCWQCSRKFRGNHHRVVDTVNGPVAVHVQCAEEMEREGVSQ